MQTVSATLGGKTLTLETGRLALQANGSVLARYGDTVVLATATIAEEPKEGVDFFPLMIDYEERFYASGKLSGSRFIKREGRPSEDAILTARLVDRPIRPLFPKGFHNDVQIILTVLSADLTHDPDVLSIIAASAAVMLTGAPFAGPVAGVRVGQIDGELVINPTYEEMDRSTLDLVVAANEKGVVMIEAGASEVDEDTMVKAISFAQESMRPALEAQKELQSQVGPVAPKEYPLFLSAPELKSEVKQHLGTRISEAIATPSKGERNTHLDSLLQDAFERFVSEELPENAVSDAFHSVVGDEFRKQIVEVGKRPDGRQLDEIRPITIEVDVLPRPHGSAMFKRGETQALSIVTLGSLEEAQMIDTMEEETEKRYMHHYNFPPFATGEVKPMRSTGRREIGHGALAERALVPVLPGKEEFPYTIRVVSEILGSNGSSSMASVCGSTLSLMAAGVPIKKPVSGIAMGVVIDKESGKYSILSDIAGIEDFNGDMDFKVAGTKDGITAIQLDMKVPGMPVTLLQEALTQAKKGRLEIMDKMLGTIAEPRPTVAETAPKVVLVKVNPDKIGEIIGPGGKIINQMINEAGGKEVTNISIEQDGSVYISSTDMAMLEKAKRSVEGIAKQFEPGERFEGKVTRVLDFGAFVEVLPGREGLVHISELADHRVEKVTDEVNVGDVVPVVVKNVDEMGRLNLSIKAARRQN